MQHGYWKLLLQSLVLPDESSAVSVDMSLVCELQQQGLIKVSLKKEDTKSFVVALHFVTYTYSVCLFVAIMLQYIL